MKGISNRQKPVVKPRENRQKFMIEKNRIVKQQFKSKTRKKLDKN